MREGTPTPGPTTGLTPTPDDTLAEMIVDRLVEESLIMGSAADDVRRKIATGQASPDDWTYWIETAMERGTQEDRGDSTH